MTNTPEETQRKYDELKAGLDGLERISEVYFNAMIREEGLEQGEQRLTLRDVAEAYKDVQQWLPIEYDGIKSLVNHLYDQIGAPIFQREER